MTIYVARVGSGEPHAIYEDNVRVCEIAEALAENGLKFVSAVPLTEHSIVVYYTDAF